MVAAIIQARTGSTRLPNKIFREFCGKPLIWHVVNRIKESKRIDKIILATTLNKNDDSLEKWAAENNTLCFRGSEANVLDRFFFAAKHYSADIIVRITADDPFKDPDIIDEVIDLLICNNLDFACNNNPPSFPEGLDTEVFTMKALELAQQNSRDDFEREHVTQHFYRNPGLFKQECLKHKTDLSYLRWTIDTLADWQMSEVVYNRLFKNDHVFRMNEILELLKSEPEIAVMNRNVERSTMYKNKKQ